MAKKKKADEPKVLIEGQNEINDTVNFTQNTNEILTEEQIPYVYTLDMKELVAYDEACRMICSHYDREMKLNELERRNYTKEQINYNREKYVKYVNIHNKLREVIENKIEILGNNENW